MPDEFVKRDRTARLVRVYAPNWSLRISHGQRVRRLTGLSLLGGPLAIGLLLSVMLPAQAGAESAVNKHNGNYVFTHIDAALTVEGTRVVFQRAYNSLDSRVTTLGPAWTHSFAMRLLPSAPLSPDVIVVGPSGRSDLFHWDVGAGTYSGRPDHAISLARGPDGTYITTEDHDAVWTFDAAGRLLQTEEPNGQHLEMVYGQNGLATVRMPSGQVALEFAYEAPTGRLVEVRDAPNPAIGAAPRAVRFAYDDQGRLAKVTDREGQVTQYAYDSDSVRLRSITDALGHVALTLTYDDQGRVASRSDARGLRTGWAKSLTYSANADGTHVSRELTVPSSFAPTWQPVIGTTSDGFGEALSYSTQPGPADTPELIAYTYGPVGSVQSVIRTGGATPVPAGLPLSVGAPLPFGVPGLAGRWIGDPSAPLPLPACPDPPTPPARASEVEIRAGPLMIRDPRAPVLQQAALAAQRASNHTLDAYGRLATFLGPEIAGVPEDQRTWRFEYDREDRVLAVEGSPALPIGLARRTEFRYDAVGNVVEVRRPR